MQEGKTYVKCAACGHVFSMNKGPGVDTIRDVSCPKCGHRYGEQPDAGPGTKKPAVARE